MRLLRQSLLMLILTLVAIEAVGLVNGNNGYFWFARQLYLTAKATRLIGSEGLWTYAPNSEIVFAATYRLSAIEGWVEYLCRFRTNNFGLIDTNYDEDRHQIVDYLVLGDSFLEGHGGCPWLTRKSLPEGFPIVVNGGLQGASIRTMELLDEWLSAQLSIRNVVVLAISNDFKRMPSPGIWATRSECLVERRCKPGVDFVWALPTDVSRESLAEMSRHFPDQSREPLWGQIEATLSYHSMSFNIIERFVTAIGGVQAVPRPSEENAFTINFNALSRLRAKYPKLKLVMVPQRDEVGVYGVENQDTTRVKRFLSEEHFAYQSCLLKLSDFMPIDGHPNVAGYRKLRSCLDRELQQ
jgi:hypothetical protein